MLQNNLQALQEQVNQLERRITPTIDFKYGQFTLVPVYINRVSEDGHRIYVCELNSSNEHLATSLSPIPTNMLDGRRLQGFPIGKHSSLLDREDMIPSADTALCAVINRRWYILGYFNLPDEITGDTVSYATKLEQTLPAERDILLKISDIGSILIKNNNIIDTYLGSWAQSTATGEYIDDENNSQESEFSSQYANYKHIAWGGLTHWYRTKNDSSNDSWPTSFIDVKTKKFEPPSITDFNLGQKDRNAAIDDTTNSNPKNSGYVDKVIKKAGTIDNDTHVYEREVRQSKENNKEKTVFTRLREGNREGIISEYSTEDTLVKTSTLEQLGSEIGDDKRIMVREYKYHDGSDSQTPEDFYKEEFGKSSSNLYKSHVESKDKKYLDITFVDDGTTTIEVGTDSSTYKVKITLDADGKLIIDTEDELDINIIGDANIDSDGDITLTSTTSSLAGSTVKLDSSGSVEITGSGSPGSITIGPGSESIVTKSELDSALSAVVSFIENHAHMATAPGAPTTPASACPITTAMKAVYSAQKAGLDATLATKEAKL